MDVFDQATVHEEMHRNAAIQSALSRLSSDEPDWVNGVPYCRKCGEEIPMARIRAYPTGICIACARELESRT